VRLCLGAACKQEVNGGTKYNIGTCPQEMENKNVEPPVMLL
jgi:hypothetical protein